uniref:Cytochrome P450 CYP80F5 n=1 Tax=Panax ginseng TaxID=4054 RepID=A0A3Q9BGP9_PANGI|nr:cytochrome P450 CYP80F5 [Panax ginseng]
MNLTTKDLGDMNTLFLGILVLSLISLIIFKHTSKAKTLPLPPGPYAWPLVGNIFQMRGKPPHLLLANLAKIHGPLISLRLGAQLVVVGSSPAAAEEILKVHDRILSGRCVASRQRGSKLHNLSSGLSEECGDAWKNIRGIYRSELFSTKAIESQVKIREKKAMEMVSYLGSKQGEILQIKEIVFVTVMNIISNMLFSVDFGDFEGVGLGKEMRGYIRRFGEVVSTPQLADLYPLLGGFDVKGMYNKLMLSDLYEKTCACWGSIVKERKEGKIDQNHKDFMDALIGKGFTDDQINPLIEELFGAGIETTTATSEWLMVELLKNQQAMNKLRDELEKVIGVDTVRESYLPNLPYLEACVKETLRLHPLGPLLLPHRAVQTCEVMGYKIPKDTQILVNMWAIARDSNIWDDPLSFKPERFIGSGVDYKGLTFEYIPFGSGRRMCPGQPFASRTIPLIVASLIHNYDWFLPIDMEPSKIDMKEMIDMIMQKEEPLSVIPKLRTLLR